MCIKSTSEFTVPDVKNLHRGEHLGLEDCSYIEFVLLLLCCRTYGNDTLEKSELTIFHNVVGSPESHSKILRNPAEPFNVLQFFLLVCWIRAAKLRCTLLVYGTKSSHRKLYLCLKFLLLAQLYTKIENINFSLNSNKYITIWNCIYCLKLNIYVFKHTIWHFNFSKSKEFCLPFAPRMYSLLFFCVFMFSTAVPSD